MGTASQVQFFWWRVLHDWTHLRRPRYLSRKAAEFGIQKQGRHYKARVLGKEMLFTAPHLSNTINEVDSWERDYLPTDVKGKVVLSVGDGCGETSLFYLAHGAAKVIAIEKEQEAFELLCKNVRENNLNVEAMNDAFKLAHLDIAHDFMKIDIEGGEKILLESRSRELTPCVIEAHRYDDDRLPEKLQKRFGMRQLSKNGRNAVLLTNVR